jgi:GTP cyclohydrolase II
MLKRIEGFARGISTLALGLTAEERVARARSDLRMGAVVAIAASGKGALVMSAEMASPERLAVLRSLGGRLDLAVTRWRAETLHARAYDMDIARICVPRDVDASWIKATADPSEDLRHPMKGPFHTRREGDAAFHRAAIRLCKSAHLLPAALVLEFDDMHAIAAEHDLTILPLDEVTEASDLKLVEVSAARVPLTVSSMGRVRVFRPSDGGEEHYAIEIGTPHRPGPVLSRLHSACFTGDVIGSLKCDCGPQLHAALENIAAEGQGILLYLNQEGRGIGLANKMRAYALQDQGFDTVEANHRLGFEDDERDFRIGAMMLKALGFTSVRLMTNNPAKVAKMNATGVTVVERVPLKVGRRPENEAYLATKAAKSGHLL